MPTPPIKLGPYNAKDRRGVVHHCRARQWYREYDSAPVDEACCGETDYMDRTEELVTCIMCIGEASSDGN